MKPAVFLDRDGTLIEESNFLIRENQIHVFDNTATALKMLKDAGFLLIVVSNQSGVARGYLTEERVEEINKVVFNQLRMLGEVPDAFYFCPHYPDGEVEKYSVNCKCRKPGTGMVEKAMQRFEIDLQHSYSVGDRLSDVGVGQNLGGKGILVLTGYGEIQNKDITPDSEYAPDYIARDILEAAQWILLDSGLGI